MKVNSERVFELMYLLFQEKPWLIKPGLLKDGDPHFEDEALAFMLTLDTATDWGSCSEPAQRLVATMLVDFMTKLKGPFAVRQWQPSPDFEPWLQAVQIIFDEILGNHPHLSRTH